MEQRVVQDRASRIEDPHEKADPRACTPWMSRGGESEPDDEMRRMLAAAELLFLLLLILPMVQNKCFMSINL